MGKLYQENRVAFAKFAGMKSMMLDIVGGNIGRFVDNYNKELGGTETTDTASEFPTPREDDYEEETIERSLEESQAE